MNDPQVVSGMQEAQDSLFVRRLPSATCGNIWASGYPAASVGGKVAKHPELHQLLQQVASGSLIGYLLFPGPGSKDLTRVAAQRNQCSRVDCQSCSSGDDSSDSNTQSREKQQSSDALGIESAHNQHEHKDTPGTSPSLQNGGTAQGTVSKIVPSHPANAPPVLDNSHHTPPSLSVVSPDAFSPQQASSSVNEQAIRSTGDQKKACALPYVLFAIDGTWQEAKEIYKAVAPHFLHTASGIQQVQLPPAAEGGKAWLLRTEPMVGFVTTAEAVARAVAILEGDQGDLLAKLLAPLKLMTELQAQFDPSLRERLQRQCQ